jgi:hypothetical protein
LINRLQAVVENAQHYNIFGYLKEMLMSHRTFSLSSSFAGCLIFLSCSAALAQPPEAPSPSVISPVTAFSPPPREVPAAPRTDSADRVTIQSIESNEKNYKSLDNDRMGSTLVPMDSWIYPALERLADMGLIPSQQVAIRPWTRQECRRQVREAEESLNGFPAMDNPVSISVRSEAESMLPELEHYLREPETQSKVVLESVYARYGSIMGPALTDSFHIGQTWWNDFGRPLGRGGSLITGYSLRATSGRYFFYSRQEMQTTQGSLAVSQPLADYYNYIDNYTFGTTPPGFNLASPAIPAYVRQRPIDLYAGMTFAGYNLSFGKQEIYWGPNTMGPLSFSSNAEPTYNLRFTSSHPHDLPLFPTLGTYSIDLVFGKLSGHHYPARPYFNGQKINFNFGRNLEMSFTRWSILWGAGHPMTLRSLKDNFISANSTGALGYGAHDDPGDRKSAFDFRLHVPGLENFVTIYADSYADDDLSPLAAPRRNPWAPGIYLARLPGSPHMDFRLEMTSTQELSQDEGNHRIYINNQYRDGNTNKGFLLGNATGRDARAFEGRLGYWVSARTRIEGGYRQEKISPLYLTNGGTISDGFIRGNYAIGKDWNIELFSQVERFLIPVVAPGRQTNGSVRLQITWDPNKTIARLLTH